jgi:hypothetical protein
LRVRWLIIDRICRLLMILGSRGRAGGVAEIRVLCRVGRGRGEDLL